MNNNTDINTGERITVIGANGHLGRRIIAHLLHLGVEGEQITATSTHLDKIQDLTKHGIQTRWADYDEPGSLTDAMRGTQTLILVSSPIIGNRVRHHANAIQAAHDAKVTTIIYTSITKASEGHTILADEHRQTEQILTQNHPGNPNWVIARNCWYMENYLDNLGNINQHKAITTCAGNGHVSLATRSDLAEAIARIAMNPTRHHGHTYELAGENYTLAQIAEAIGKASGTTITLQNTSQSAYKAILEKQGLPEVVANMLADADEGISRGELATTSGDLHKLLHREPTTLEQALADPRITGLAGSLQTQTTR